MLDELTELLELGPSDLSLGERMKCEIAAALLHRPSVVFLGEPTSDQYKVETRVRTSRT